MKLDEEKRRLHDDFAYWCRRCVVIRDKLTGRDVPFVLNAPQRRVAAQLEAARHAGRPIRLIMLKARQWGGSTLIQMYMAWIQTVHCRNWHSVICAQNKDAAANIRGMYAKMLEHYPAELWDGDGTAAGSEPAFKAYERMQNVRQITGRGCRVTVTSAESQDAVRGADLAMAHLTETAFWRRTPRRDPDDMMRTICGSVAEVPLSLIAIESTANGVGNFFHTEWLRAVAGTSDKMAIFVPWYEIEIYRAPVTDATALLASLTEYERRLWADPSIPVTLEQLQWYHDKAAGFRSLQQMQAEFPTTADEAFANTGSNVFDAAAVARMRDNLPTVAPEVGEIDGGTFCADAKGSFQMWQRPVTGTEYVVAVDIGGLTDRADWSVVAVLTRNAEAPTVVAQWRGHIDHDLLAGRAVDIARYFNNACLIIESNSLESGRDADAGAADGLSVLARIRRQYVNLYCRESFDAVRQRSGSRVGFHTNRRTKPLLIDTLIAYVRDGRLHEADPGACDELSTYIRTQSGGYEASLGHHDDMLMTRALALHVIAGDGQRDAEQPLGGLFAAQW